MGSATRPSAPATVQAWRSNDRRVLEAASASGSRKAVDRVQRRGAIFMSIKLPLRREDGGIYALCGISTDITEEKRTEREAHSAPPPRARESGGCPPANWP